MNDARLRILVIDDEPAMREVLEARLGSFGYEVQTAETAAEGRAAVHAFDPDVVISDLVLPDMSGLDLLESLREGRPGRRVFMITAYGTIDAAVEAMKRGAVEFLTKPLDYVVLRRLLEESPPLARAASSAVTAIGDSSSEDAPTDSRAKHMVGKSETQLALLEMIDKVSPSDATVLIVGESGAGKELVAQTIHERSDRHGGPFVPVNAAAIPEGMTEGMLLGHERGAFTGANESRAGFFEQAHGGTLFLDEITEMPIGLQAKFLRVLEDGRVRRIGGAKEIQTDVRIIAATNRDPSLAVQDGHLRQDLFFRLNVLRIDVPPLRERLDDLPLLIDHFVRHFNEKYSINIEGIETSALQALRGYSWPGNVRELRNVLERAVILTKSGVIDHTHLPTPDSPVRERAQGIVVPAGSTLASAERILILETLRQTGNNKTEAARRLGLDVKTIRNRLKAFEQQDEHLKANAKKEP